MKTNEKLLRDIWHTLKWERLLPVVVIAMSTLMFSCNPAPDRNAQEASEDLGEADRTSLDTINEIEAARANAEAAWKQFKAESDSSIASLENDLRKMEVTLETAKKNEKQNLYAEYSKVKDEITVLKDKLHQRNVAFESDIKAFDNTVSEKTESFKREFKHDTDELGKSIKALFKDNVK
ncbi:hypothetical protein GCM10011386_14090 [Parapedobacter defluvii]|uniref:Uncharacterized protein n=1 Tax=Parapedobacter defluvii TaxID=2045106 RepID=A0ABQ1LEI0_9SPHI|nr:hypothetical protein [Parapedobacter defluvii]GGC23368.1 hypothetical protein GCM10011386_14090 [Parapedobacter defluvii]